MQISKEKTYQINFLIRQNFAYCCKGGHYFDNLNSISKMEGKRKYLSTWGVIKVEHLMQGVDWDQAKFMMLKVRFINIKIVV